MVLTPPRATGPPEACTARVTRPRPCCCVEAQAPARAAMLRAATSKEGKRFIEFLPSRKGDPGDMGRSGGTVSSRGVRVKRRAYNHKAAIALYAMWYNFARIHQTLRVTPAMEAGISDHLWSAEESARARR